MIERVARALCIQKDGWRNDQGFIDRQWHIHLDAARAAIEAMREPTEAMIAAGAEQDNWCLSEMQAPQPDVYRAMIDAALAEKIS